LKTHFLKRPGWGDLATKVTEDFNIFAVTSDPRVVLLQRYLAEIGVLTHNGFGIKSAEQKQNERQREEEEFLDHVREGMKATAEQIEAFHVDLQKLDEERIELLSKTEQQLREVRERLKKLRDEAPEMTMPDGSRRSLFRDGDRVRDETGAFVDTEIVKPEAVSKDEFNWRKYAGGRKIEAVLSTRYDNLIEDGSKIAKAHELSAAGKMSPEAMTAFKKAQREEFDAMKQPLPDLESELAGSIERTLQANKVTQPSSAPAPK
jgi:hypothetical protein